MIKIAAIKPNQLATVWQSVMFHVERALEYEHGELDVNKVYNAINEGRFILLVAMDTDKAEIIASQTLEYIQVADKLICNLVTTAGDNMEQWQDELAATIEQLAKEQGCHAIQTRGRPGWLKQLKRNGFKPLYFTAEKLLV